LLLRALGHAARRVGVEFRTGYVRRIVTTNDTLQGIEMDGVHVAAGAVILAAGSWSGLVDGGLLPSWAVQPVRGQMVELESQTVLPRHIIYSGHGYVIPRRDGRIVCGSTMEEVGF